MFGFVLVHSQADGLWGCLRSEAIRNKAAMTIHAQVLVFLIFLFVMGMFVGVKLPGCMVNLGLTS